MLLSFAHMYKPLQLIIAFFVNVAKEVVSAGRMINSILERGPYE